MAVANPADGTLSPSMQQVLRDQREPVDAGSLVNQIIDSHRHYAGSRAQAIAAQVAWPQGLRSQSVQAWFDEVRTVLRPDPGELRGRLVVLGLALCERPLGQELVRSGLFHAVLQDTDERHALFGERGQACLTKIPRARIGSEAGALEPIVLTAPGCRGRRGALSPDGSRAVGYAEEGESREVALWHVESHQLIARLEPPVAVRMARFSQDGRYLRALLRDGSVGQWPLAQPDATHFERLTGPIDRVASGALSGDATAACVRVRGPLLVLLDLASRTTTAVELPSPATRICMSADGSRFAVAHGRTGRSQTWADGVVADPEPFEFEAPVDALECTRDETFALVGGSLKVVRGTVADAVESPAGAQRIAVAPDGSLVACAGSPSGSLVLLQPRSGITLGTLGDGETGAIRSSFSLEGRRLVTCHRDESMRVWDVGLRPSSSRLPPSGFDNDNPDDGRDLLGRDRDVDAFASLIAAKSVRPPLSIGIFAHWGGGKSWFMERLRRKVASLAADATHSRLPQSQVAFYQNIAQVTFNAWHYSESDILASLVDHILTRLDMGEPVDAFTAERRKAQADVALAAKDASAAQTQLEQAEAKLRQLEATRLAQELRRREEEDALRTKHLSDEALNRALPKTQDALRTLGWGGVPDAATDLLAALRQARDELTRARGLLTPSVVGQPDERDSERRWLLRAILFGPLLGVLVGGLGWVALGDDGRALLTGLGAFLAGTAGAVATAIHRQADWLRKRLDAIAEAEREIETDIAKKLAEVDQAVHDARTQEITQRAEVSRLATTQQEKFAALATRENALDKIRPEKSLADLVSDRVRTGQYSSRLGLVAQARRDFEQVSDLVGAVNLGLEQDDDPGEQPKVSRIVLYVDDLDRCEPAKVAQVLQAVHLLLAFPLFVVVVGVDPRWVGRALRTHYPELLVGDGGGPEEYLEKIFQIPFWLDALNPAATRSMLAGLAGASARRVPQGTPPPMGNTSDITGTTTPTDRREPDSTDRGSGRGGTGAATRSAELNPASLRIERHELDAMEELSGVLGRSPRAVKRFLNTYRLIKVQAEDPTEFAHPQRPDADYRIVLYLLAESTGRPDTAVGLFERIRNLTDDDVVDSVPEGWPRDPRPYQAWLDEVGRFSFLRHGDIDEDSGTPDPDLSAAVTSQPTSAGSPLPTA